MGLLDRMDPRKGEEKNAGMSVNPTMLNEESAKAEPIKEKDPYFDIKRKIHSDIIREMNKTGQSITDRAAMFKIIDDRVNDDENMIARIDRPQVATELFNDIMGYGPIEELIQNPKYTEIMVNGPDHIYIEEKGKLKLTGLKFRDEEHLMNVIDRIVSQVGRHVDEASPMVDARLLDGSRVNAIIPPLSLVGPVLTIRKFGKNPITAQQLLQFGSLNPKMLQFLEACVKGKLNIVCRKCGTSFQRRT